MFDSPLAPLRHLLSYSAAGLVIGALMIVPIAAFRSGWPDTMDQAAWTGVLYLGFFPTALATLLLVRVINMAGPSFLSLVNYQVPIWAVLFGMVFLGEALPASFLAALGLILFGLAISQMPSRQG